MGFISCHIMPLVINNLRGGHTHTQAYNTEPFLKNQACGQHTVSLKMKQAFCSTNNAISNYFHLETDLLMKKQKVVRLWPHLLH